MVIDLFLNIHSKIYTTFIVKLFQLVFLLIMPLFSFGQSLSTEPKDSSGIQFSISDKVIKNILTLPEDTSQRNDITGIPIPLVMPDGTTNEYFFFRNQTMHAEMIAAYPDILTLTGYASKHKNHFVQATYYDGKLNVFILTDKPKPTIIQHVSGETYRSFYGERTKGFECGTESENKRFMPPGLRTSTNGGTLKNYDFAIVITDEYEAANGGGSAAVAVAVATVNNINAIYKRDLAVTFTAIVRPETTTFNINPQFSPTYGATCIAAYFSSSEYDLGQVFHYDANSGGGVAALGVVCSNGGSPINKARSWSQSFSNQDYGFTLLVVHEVAHMFNATHIFNSDEATTCNSNRTSATAYEPGGGTTLMAYPGACPFNQIGQNITDAFGNVINDSAPYFNVRNLEQMVTFITGNGNSCASASNSGNTPPISLANACNAGSPVLIPINTPFELIGGYTDPDNDVISYCWEQYDVGPPHGGPSAACGSTSGPVFRSYPPSSSPSRTFPDLYYVINNNNTPIVSAGECLPTVGRLLNFRLTVRDNNTNAGGIDVSALQLQIQATAGPLSVTSPNTATTVTAGNNLAITWSVNNTNSICNTINIKLSIDGGYTYPITLVSSTPNDGTQTVTIPTNTPSSNTARIRVESSCLTCVKFFDISNANITINSNCLVKASNICPSNPVTFSSGNSGLNLGLTFGFGIEFTTKVLTTSGSTVNSSFNLTPIASGAGNCTFGNFGFAQTSFKFRINKAGNYNFNSTGTTIFSLYNGSYTTSTPCTNYMGSTSYDLDGISGGNVSIENQMTLSLTNICGEYTGVLFASSGSSNTLSISGPDGAIVYESNAFTNNDYSYTYVAVNSASNLIVAVSAASNFTSLVSGSYKIYGVHYYSGAGPTPPNVNPNSWINQDIDVIRGNNSCLAFSTNFKNVTVTCAPSVTSSANSGPGTLRDLATCYQSGSTILFSAGINPVLTAPLNINKSLIFDGLTDTQNNPITSIFFNYANNYGLKVESTNNVTLKDLNIVGQSTVSPAILNEGILNLNNAKVQGNVNPVMQSQNGGSVTIINNNVVKKQ